MYGTWFFCKPTISQSMGIHECMFYLFTAPPKLSPLHARGKVSPLKSTNEGGLTLNLPTSDRTLHEKSLAVGCPSLSSMYQRSPAKNSCSLQTSSAKVSQFPNPSPAKGISHPEIMLVKDEQTRGNSPRKKNLLQPQKAPANHGHLQIDLDAVENIPVSKDLLPQYESPVRDGYFQNKLPVTEGWPHRTSTKDVPVSQKTPSKAGPWLRKPQTKDGSYLLDSSPMRSSSHSKENIEVGGGQ